MNKADLQHLAIGESADLAERIHEAIQSFKEENPMTIAINEMQEMGVIKDNLWGEYEVALLNAAWDRAYAVNFGNEYEGDEA